MKKLLTLAAVAAMLFTSTVSVFAEPAAELILDEKSRLVLDREAGIIDKLDGPLTVGELKAEFIGDVSVGDKADDALVATDDAVTAGEDSLRAIIWGDVDRNGKVDLLDVVAIIKSVAGWDADISDIAADVDRDGDVSISDGAKLLKYVAEWEDVSLGNVRMVFENKSVPAEAEDATLRLTFVDMMYKHGREPEAYPADAYSFKMKMAKNETESCQAIIYSENDREGLSAELSAFLHEDGEAIMESKLEWVRYYDHSLAWPIIKSDRTKETGNWLNTEEYVNWISADIPEVLLSMADTFELEAGLVQHLVISTTSTKNTPAGMYTATLDIKEGDKVIKTAVIYAYVWDFALPDAPYSASLFANGSYKVDPVTGEGDGIDYYNMMLDNNLSSYVLPYDITDPRADAYMTDPRVTAFVIAGGGNLYGLHNMYGGIMDCSDEETVANYEKVMSNPDWAKKGLFYYTDEPYGEGLFNIRDTYNYVTELLGTTNIRNMTPIGQSYPNAEYQAKCIDSIEFAKDYINVWCPTSDAYHRVDEGGHWTPRFVLSKHGEYPERAAAFRERGDDIWWYVCCSPEIPYPNYFTWYQGVVVRLLSWQQYFNNVDGVLYYGIGVHWDKISKYQFNIYNGDGVLAFPGEFWGRVGPSPSWRLYQIRDGFDDFDYLKLAEEIAGREEVMKIVTRVSSGILRYTEDYNVLNACREEIADIILEAQK